MRLLVLVMVGLMSLPAYSAWQLNENKSALSFVSIKKGDIAEVHQFKGLSGYITEQHKVHFAIDLTSVDTKVAIRDQRMRDYLFKTTQFASASFSANLAPDLVSSIEVGSSMATQLTGDISLHGQSQAVSVPVMIAKLMNNKIQVAATAPLVINAQQFKLADGVAKLQALAGLPSISNAVPITFVLTFENK